MGITLALTYFLVFPGRHEATALSEGVTTKEEACIAARDHGAQAWLLGVVFADEDAPNAGIVVRRELDCSQITPLGPLNNK